MPLSWLSQPANAGDTVLLDPEEAHHVLNVLRHQRGNALTLTDGRGAFYDGKIQAITRKSVEVYLEDKRVSPASVPELTLAAALLKGDKTDFVVQKATELGVCRFQPLLTQHTLVKKEVAEAKKDRWQKISREALKQCERAHEMTVQSPVAFRDFLSQEADLKIFFWENSKEPAKVFFKKNTKELRTVIVVIGPEGGFTEEEAQAAVHAGYAALSLGTHVLKADTAALAAVAVVLHETSHEP